MFGLYPRVKVLAFLGPDLFHQKVGFLCRTGTYSTNIKSINLFKLFYGPLPMYGCVKR